MPRGKYFWIKSKMSGLVLDIEKSDTDPGTPVAMWDQKSERKAKNQLFYVDLINGCIRTKLNDFVLDFNDDNSLVIDEFEEGKESQLWGIVDDSVKNSATDEAFDIAGNDMEKGARVCKWEFHGGENQQWEFDWTDPIYFLIKSEMNGKVLDIPEADPSPGVKVVMWDEKGEDNQLWYEDAFGNIRSKLNKCCLDASSGGSLRMEPIDPGNLAMQWQVLGNKIVNRENTDEVLDIKRADDDNGARLCRHEYKGDDNQHWELDFA